MKPAFLRGVDCHSHLELLGSVAPSMPIATPSAPIRVGSEGSSGGSRCEDRPLTDSYVRFLSRYGLLGGFSWSTSAKTGASIGATTASVPQSTTRSVYRRYPDV